MNLSSRLVLMYMNRFLILPTSTPAHLFAVRGKRKPSTAITAEENIHFCIRTNSARTNRLKLVKNKNKLRELSGLEV